MAVVVVSVGVMWLLMIAAWSKDIENPQAFLISQSRTGKSVKLIRLVLIKN
jgi:hypothetical protein